MQSLQIFRHGDYALHCEARLLDNGRFVPMLSILRQRWPSRPKEIAMPRDDHATRDEAIAAAHQLGVTWIRDFG